MIGFYILAFASGGCVRPFVNLYLVEVGLSGTQIGFLQGWTALVSVAFTPLVGLLADRTQRHRLFLEIVIFLKSLFAPLILLSNTFWWLTTTFSLRNISASVSDALNNGLTLTRLREKNRSDLGTIRLWGSISYAATSALAGFLAHGRSIGVLFPLSGVLGFLSMFFIRTFPARISTLKPTLAVNGSIFKRSSAMLFLFLLILLFSFSRESLDTFGFVYLSEALGAGNDLIGILGAMIGLAPLLALYLADWCISHWGKVTALGISFGLLALSLWGYALIPTSLFAIPVVILQGFSISIFLISLVVALGDLSLQQNAATDQVLAQVTIPGLAGILAQPISGRIYDVLGGRMLFSIDSLILVAAIVLLVGFYKRL